MSDVPGEHPAEIVPAAAEAAGLPEAANSMLGMSDAELAATLVGIEGAIRDLSAQYRVAYTILEARQRGQLPADPASYAEQLADALPDQAAITAGAHVTGVEATTVERDDTPAEGAFTWLGNAATGAAAPRHTADIRIDVEAGTVEPVTPVRDEIDPERARRTLAGIGTVRQRAEAAGVELVGAPEPNVTYREASAAEIAQLEKQVESYTDLVAAETAKIPVGTPPEAANQMLDNTRYALEQARRRLAEARVHGVRVNTDEPSDETLTDFLRGMKRGTWAEPGSADPK